LKFILLFFFVAATAAVASPAPVAFDWFEYTGRDPAFATPLAPGQFRNPILAGFYPDPSICRVPGKGASGADAYYLVNSTFAYFPGIPIFHSRDLVNWTQLGHVIDQPTQLDYDKVTVTHGLFAPTINWHDGTFYVLCTIVDGHWWSVFLGCRPFAGKWWTTGRETFLLPVTWTDDGWPQILPPGERVPYAVSAPR
jgi:alpha-N-arabinofuranosidase